MSRSRPQQSRARDRVHRRDVVLLEGERAAAEGPEGRRARSCGRLPAVARRLGDHGQHALRRQRHARDGTRHRQPEPQGDRRQHQ